MRPGQGNRRMRRNNGGHQHSHNGGHNSMPGQQRSHAPRTAVSLRNQIFDSNGPDTRVRGNAFQVHEKYLALAKDALSSGDRVLAENYLQHAEHYYRIIEAINEATAAEQRLRQPYMGASDQPQGPQGSTFYGSVSDIAPPAPQTPLGTLNSPVAAENVSSPEAEPEDEDIRSLPDSLQAAGGRR